MVWARAAAAARPRPARPGRTSTSRDNLMEFRKTSMPKRHVPPYAWFLSQALRPQELAIGLLLRHRHRALDDARHLHRSCQGDGACVHGLHDHRGLLERALYLQGQPRYLSAIRSAVLPSSTLRSSCRTWRRPRSISASCRRYPFRNTRRTCWHASSIRWTMSPKAASAGTASPAATTAPRKTTVTTSTGRMTSATRSPTSSPTS